MKARPAFVCAVLLAVGLYLVTLSRSWTADSLLYALDIESGDPARMVDPYHLLLHPLGWVFYQLWRLAGWSGGSLLPLQVLNALGGALCVGLFYLIARRLTGSAWTATLAAAGVTVSGGLWLLSVEVEFVTIPLAAYLAVLWLLLAAPSHWAQRPTYALGLGLAVVGAALTYLTALLLLGVVVAGLLSLEVPRSVRLRQAATVAGVVLGVAGTGLLLFLAAWSRGDPVESLRQLGGGGVYGQLSWTNLPQGAYAFLRSLALYPGLVMNESTRAFLASAAAPERALFGVYYLVVLAVALFPLILALRQRHCLWIEYRRELAVLAVWTALYGGFAVYWVPGDLSFWVPLLAAWWLLAALVLPALQHGPVLMAAGVLLLLLANGLLVIVPRHDLARNSRYVLAQELAEHTERADLILIGGDDALVSLYLAYFARRQAALVPLDGSAVEASAQWASLAVGQASRRGSRIFAAGFPPNREWILDLVSGSAAGALGGPCRRLLAAWQVLGGAVWELCPPS